MAKGARRLVADRPQAARGGLGCVLIVEDDAILSLALEDMLRGAGARKVVVATTTEEALHALEQFRPAILVLDVHLADRDDGWAVAELAVQLSPKPPQIVFSTATPTQIPPRVAEMGVVLAKPYTQEDLLAVLGHDRPGGLFARLIHPGT